MKGVNLAIAVLMIIALSSCKNVGDNCTIGFLVHTLADERWSVERDIFTARVNELGGKVLFENAQQDEREQLRLAEKMIDEGADVLVVVPVNSKTAASISRLCQNNGVKLISYDIMIDNSVPDLFISFDNLKVGELMASYAVSHCSSGNYVLLWGDGSMNVAQWVREGQMKVLNKYIEEKKINVIYKAYVDNWSNESASNLMNKVFDNTSCDIDAIIASSDGIADGVIQSYEGRDFERYPLLTGQDASNGAMKYIKDGIQSMTIYKAFDKMAVIAADAALDLAMGKKVKADTVLNNGRADIPSILLEPSVIDHGNMNQLIVKDY